MSLHQYLCPKCGLALQSPRDVAGRQVRCLGCQAVFVAAPPKSPAAPLPKPNAVQPPEWPSRTAHGHGSRGRLPAAGSLFAARPP